MTDYKQLTIPDDTRVFVVGDLHGCYTKLINKLKEIDFDFEHDLLISVGDLVDRSNENIECIKLLDKKWFKAIKGNHEDFCIQGNSDDRIAYSHKAPNNGGSWFYEQDEIERSCIVEVFKQLPILLEVEYKGKKFGFVHADVPIYDWDILVQNVVGNKIINGRSVQEYCLWSRNIVYKDTINIKNIDRVFLGHTVLNKIKNVGNCTFLDTGAVFGGELSIVNLNVYI